MKGFQVKACITCIISKTGYLKFSILDQKVLKNILRWLKKKNQGKKWMFDFHHSQDKLFSLSYYQ